VAGLPLGRSELFGATSGGVRIDDPACDLAVAAALASAATGVAPPEGSAFVGEVALTGIVRAAPGMAQRLSAARAAGCTSVYAAETSSAPVLSGLEVITVDHLSDALGWVLSPAATRPRAVPDVPWDLVPSGPISPPIGL
jgi:DNA repair protein RadA/Sms